MLETADFFQEQIKQCLSRAAQSAKKDDREFWSKMANRWEGLWQARKPRDGATEPVQKFGFQRAIAKTAARSLARGRRRRLNDW